MSDIKTVWIADKLSGDWVYLHGSLASGDDLTTAITISLFTDRRAKDDDVIPDGSNDRRGWWGDDGQDVNIGSRLWLLKREKQTNATLLRAKTYIEEALQWAIDDGVVEKFTIHLEWPRAQMLSAQITVHMPDGNDNKYKYSWAWGDVN